MSIGTTNDYTIDFGFTPVGSIGDTVWMDLDGDGTINGSEAGIPNVVVELEMPDGSIITATTDSSGNYLFPGLPYDTYTVTVVASTLPANVAQTYDNDGTLDHSSSTTLSSSNPNDLDQDFGYQPVGSIGDTVWMDSNGDGVQDSGENGIAGVVVELEMPDGSVITTTTNGSGMYLFSNLPYGSYDVTVVPSSLPAGVAQTYDQDGTLDHSSSTTIDATTPDDLDQDFGYQPAAGTIGDTVWIDLDGDGLLDSGENGIPNVVIELELPDGSVITTTTDSSGNYQFTGLPFGTYTVTVVSSTLPANLTQTFDDDGVLDHMSSTTLTATAPSDLDQDFGYQPPLGSIGDFVWLDTNGDGVQDSGESGIAGVTVELELPDGSVITTTTNGSGGYLFPDLPAGNYSVTVDISTLPAPYAQSFDADGIASATTSTLTLAVGEDNSAQDFGYVPGTTAVALRGLGADSGAANNATRAMVLVILVGLVIGAGLMLKRSGLQDE